MRESAIALNHSLREILLQGGNLFPCSMQAEKEGKNEPAQPSIP
jgi:hypothetical protein